VNAVASAPAQPQTQPAPPDDPSAAATEACPLCGAPLAPTQEWCLHCGAAARTRLAAAPNWKAPVAILAAVVLLSLGAIAAALVKIAGDTGPAPPTVTRTVVGAAAGAAAPPASAAPGAATPLPTGTTPTGPSATTPGAPAATTPGAATPATPGSTTTTNQGATAPKAAAPSTGTNAPGGRTGTSTGATTGTRGVRVIGPIPVGVSGVHSEPGVPGSSTQAGGGK
jgi:hypothetical protein